MADSRARNAKRNVLSALLGQAVKLVCGLLLPRLMLEAFGSEAVGAASSISSFLAYITLLEGGVGGVTRAALYKPLAEGDNHRVAVILGESQRYFRFLAGIFLVYVGILACCFHRISGVTCFDWITTFWLVIIISASTLVQYLFGMTYSIFLQASQKVYLSELLSIVATLLETVVIVILVQLGSHFLVVKLATGVVFIIRPVVLWAYVRRKNPLLKTKDRDPKALSQKWAGLGQHIAYFLHSNTDVVVLTLLVNLKSVAVYSVYRMVLTQIENITVSFTSGMEALFGDMLAKGERDQLSSTLGLYEMLLSCVTVTLLATTGVMILPFVRLYTRGITDANYMQPLFAALMVCAVCLYCLRLPYHNLVIAAGLFRQTQGASYLEAGLNIVISVLLAARFGLPGVAAGTVIATGYRYVYYAVFLSKHILCRPLWQTGKRFLVNALSFGASMLLGTRITVLGEMENYLQWMIVAAGVFVITMGISVGVNFLLYREEFLQAIRRFLKKRRF